jgi:hypothetical protein
VNRTWLTLGICGLVVLLVGGSVQASDWGLPNLNPFSSPASKRSNQPSMWTKMSRGTKDFFSRTYDVLTPWETDAQKARSQNSRSSGFSANSGKSSSQSRSPFGNWWRTEEPPNQPQTVSEWLKQPRP